MKRFAWLVLASANLFTACTTTGGAGTHGEGARPPVSSEAPANETRQRAKVHTELGSLYLQDSRFAVALEEARIALSADADYAPAYNLLAMTHMFMNEPKLAEDNFLRALRSAPGDPEISNNFGWFLCQNSRGKEGMDYLMRAARNPLYQSPTKPYTNAGICAIQLKNDKTAEDHLVRALQLDPFNTLAMFWLADIAYRQGRLTEAKQQVSEIEKIVELNSETTWLALRVERKLGNREAEARHAAQLRRKFANSPEQRKLVQGEYE